MSGKNFYSHEGGPRRSAAWNPTHGPTGTPKLRNKICIRSVSGGIGSSASFKGQKWNIPPQRAGGHKWTPPWVLVFGGRPHIHPVDRDTRQKGAAFPKVAALNSHQAAENTVEKRDPRGSLGAREALVLVTEDMPHMRI